MIRLNRYLASCTNLSRRQADSFIRRGDVTVNDELRKDLGCQITQTDIVKVHDKIITPWQKVYYFVNKPIGYTCSVNDDYAQKLVTELVPANPPVFPVGRLDRDSRGLMIMTNDGELAQKLTHPKFKKEKEYVVAIDRKLSQGDIEKLKKGVSLEQGIGKFDSIEHITNNEYRVIIHQGLKRQIREMLKKQGYRVKDLVRVRIANIRLLDLAEGKYRKISKSDIMKLIQ